MHILRNHARVIVMLIITLTLILISHQGFHGLGPLL
jgi:hypothetical protein